MIVVEDGDVGGKAERGVEAHRGDERLLERGLVEFLCASARAMLLTLVERCEEAL
jgi:hypothetical protein